MKKFLKIMKVWRMIKLLGFKDLELKYHNHDTWGYWYIQSKEIFELYFNEIDRQSQIAQHQLSEAKGDVELYKLRNENLIENYQILQSQLEEAKGEIEKANEDNTQLHNLNIDRKKEIESLREGWISVDERLPINPLEENRVVAVLAFNGDAPEYNQHIFTANYFKQTNTFTSTASYMGTITHWRPLPPNPSNEKGVKE